MWSKGEEFKFGLTVFEDYTMDEFVYQETFDTLEQIEEVMGREDYFPKEFFHKGPFMIEICVIEFGQMVFVEGQKIDPYRPFGKEVKKRILERIKQYQKTSRVAMTPTPPTFRPGADPEKKKETKDRFVYVCPSCWEEIDKCRCGSYPYFLIQVDRNILPIVRNLNLKGYQTCGSCESHPEEGRSSMQLYFKKHYRFSEPIPGNGHYGANGNWTRPIKSIEEKEQLLKELLEWSERLPESEYKRYWI